MLIVVLLSCKRRHTRVGLVTGVQKGALPISKRLVHILHTGLFKKTVVETPLDRILNVSFRTTGILSTLFNYGDVLVEVVGLDHSLILKAIPGPSKEIG